MEKLICGRTNKFHSSIARGGRGLSHFLANCPYDSQNPLELAKAHRTFARRRLAAFSPREKVPGGRMRGKGAWQTQVHRIAAILIFRGEMNRSDQRELRRGHSVFFWPVRRKTFPMSAWSTGLTSISSMFTCGGRVATQTRISAISAATSGCVIHATCHPVDREPAAPTTVSS